jgi:branched-chain amino acid transport system ATP-binding protein
MTIPSEKVPDTNGGAESPPALAFEAVTAGYGRATVLHDVTLEVPSGAVVAMLGPNGAGKTTALRVAAGLLSPKSGSVVLDGKDVTRTRSHSRVHDGLCLIPEGRGIFPTLTVAENLRLQVPPGASASNIDRVIEEFPVLGGRRNQVAGSLSGGEQQMLALARAYQSSPKVVLVDEVSMGLAPKMVDRVFEKLRDLAEAGIALLLVEQYVHRALELADRVVLIDRGHVAFSGAPETLDEQEIVRRYMGA